MAEDFVPGGTGETYTSSIGPVGGVSAGGSQSSSYPVPVETAQTDWGLLQSQLLSVLAESQYNWAMQQYAKGEGVSDQTIANFLEMSGKGKGLADTLINQYQDQFKPLMDKYIQDAGSYASEERQAFEAGKAMSTVAQADQAAMDESARKLGGFGVNVNSGRYQDSMLAARTADAAARAGAGTKAAQDTEDRGRAMEEKAIAMGQNIPGQAMNAIQSSYAGLTGAENAILGLMNSGANLAQSAAPFFNAAVGANKVPPTGQVSQSASQQQAPSSGGGGGGGSKAAPKEKGGGGEKQPQQKQPGQPGAGKGEGEGGGGGGKGPGGAGSADAKAKAGAGPEGYGEVYKIPQTSRKSKEDPQEGTGAPTEGYTGAIPTFDETGTIMPYYDPGLGRDASGNLATPETAGFDSREQVANWTPPAMAGEGYNTGPSTTGAMTAPGIGENLPMGWNDPFSTGGTPDWGSGAQALQNWDGGSQTYPDEYQASQTYPDEYQASGQWDNSTTDVGSDMWGGWGDDTGTDWGAGDAGNTGGDQWSGWGDNTGTDWGNDTGTEATGGDQWSGWGDDTGTDWGNTEGYQSQSYPDEYQASGGDYVGAGYDSSGGGWDNYYDTGSYGGEQGYEYARGGPVRPRPRPGAGVIPSRGRPTTGGPVPRSASPSRGRQTDDISARLNAGEYVIPRDVVAHKGTEFFTKMIQNSRKLRTGMAGAKPGPTMKPGLPAGGRPGFSSRQLPGR